MGTEFKKGEPQRRIIPSQHLVTREAAAWSEGSVSEKRVCVAAPLLPAVRRLLLLLTKLECDNSSNLGHTFQWSSSMVTIEPHHQRCISPVLFYWLAKAKGRPHFYGLHKTAIIISQKIKEGIIRSRLIYTEITFRKKLKFLEIKFICKFIKKY